MSSEGKHLLVLRAENLFWCPSVSGNEVSLLAGKETLWIERGGWDCGGKGGAPPADYAEVDSRGLSTFCNPRKEQPTPYATTTILNRHECNVSYSLTTSFHQCQCSFLSFIPRQVSLTNNTENCAYSKSLKSICGFSYYIYFLILHFHLRSCWVNSISTEFDIDLPGPYNS